VLATDTAPEMSESDAVLSSSLFASNTNSGRFLRFVCDKYFAGIHQVSEGEIAVEALGRRPNFDPQQDSIVRVEAHRARKRLREYYEHEGAGHALRLILPQGTYVPQFVPSDEKPAQKSAMASTQVITPQTSLPHTLEASASVVADGDTRSHRHRWYVAGALGVAIGVITFLFFRHKEQEKVVETSRPPTSQSTSSAAASPDVLIMAGSNAKGYTDQLGHIWSSDRYSHGGEPWPIRYRRIARTDDPQLFLTARQGQDFGYDIPLKPGFYELHLFFAETFYGEDNSEGGGEASRVFDIEANGEPLLVNFDPLSDAGGSNIADVRIFAGVSPAADGKLHLRFRNRWLLKGVAFVNAIELIHTDGKFMVPVRWVSNSSAVEDRLGQLWIPDQYVLGGRRRQLREEVQGTEDPQLYQSERYGNFTYDIPVAAGATYTLTLHFSEHWFGVPGYGGVEQGQHRRIFDVTCNGINLLRDFDISKETGGSLRALTKTFHGLTPNHQGKLLLEFTPNKDYAAVTALEVLPETEHPHATRFRN
jgi:hypothetical protein